MSENRKGQINRNNSFTSPSISTITAQNNLQNNYFNSASLSRLSNHANTAQQFSKPSTPQLYSNSKPSTPLKSHENQPTSLPSLIDNSSKNNNNNNINSTQMNNLLKSNVPNPNNISHFQFPLSNPDKPIFNSSKQNDISLQNNSIKDKISIFKTKSFKISEKN